MARKLVVIPGSIVADHYETDGIDSSKVLALLGGTITGGPMVGDSKWHSVQCDRARGECFAHAQHDAGTTRPLREGYFLRTLVRGVRLNNSHRIDLNRLLARIKIFNTFRSTLNLLTRAS